jgi:hypothetical protein
MPHFQKWTCPISLPRRSAAAGMRSSGAEERSMARPGGSEPHRGRLRWRSGRVVAIDASSPGVWPQVIAAQRARGFFTAPADSRKTGTSVHEGERSPATGDGADGRRLARAGHAAHRRHAKQGTWWPPRSAGNVQNVLGWPASSTQSYAGVSCEQLLGAARDLDLHRDRSSDEGTISSRSSGAFGYRMIDLGDQKRGLRPFRIGGPVDIGNVARRARAF